MDDFNQTDNIIDVDELIDTQINGEPLYYSPTQVADILGINYSKVIYYSKYFADLLDIELSNRNRRYKKSDIEKLKFLLELAQDGLTLKQIKEYCAEKVPEDITKDVAVSNNPLQIQVLVKAMTEELDSLIDSKLSVYLKQSKEMIEESNEFIKEQVALTMESRNNDLKTYIDQKELEFRQKDQDKIDLMRKQMEETKKENEITSKKGFWSRIFGK